jgi:hypothetical protein
MKDKYFNFMGDDGNFIFNPPMPNPYGLRGNPDTQANSVDQGDGLNGTPEHFDANDRVYDYPPAYNSFDGSQWSNDGTEQTGWNNQSGGGNWFTNLFDRDGMSTYYTCENGFPISQRFATGQQPMGWTRSRNNACLTQAEIDTKKQNTINTIANILTNANQGLQAGLNINNPNSPNYAPQFDPNLNPTPQTTTTVTESGLGTTGKIVGWVLVAGVVVSLGYLAIKSK